MPWGLKRFHGSGHGSLTGHVYDGKETRVAKGTITAFSCDVIHNGFAETNLYAPGPNGKQLEESDGNFNPQHSQLVVNGELRSSANGLRENENENGQREGFHQR